MNNNSLILPWNDPKPVRVLRGTPSEVRSMKVCLSADPLNECMACYLCAYIQSVFLGFRGHKGKKQDLLRLRRDPSVTRLYQTDS